MKMPDKLKKVLNENKEDLQYLLFVGMPTFIILFLISLFFEVGETY